MTDQVQAIEDHLTCLGIEQAERQRTALVADEATAARVKAILAEAGIDFVTVKVSQTVPDGAVWMVDERGVEAAEREYRQHRTRRPLFGGG